jgi:hypothetical protein
MKSFKKLLTGTALAVAAMSTQAAIIQPSTGAGELMAVVFNPANNYSFILDLGVTLTTFNPANNQSFVLSTSPYWAQFTAALGTGVATFGVLGADSAGPAALADARRLWVTTNEGSSPVTPLANGDLANLATLTNTFQQTINGGTNVSATFLANHSSVTDGSSLSLVPSTTTSFSTLDNGVLAPSLALMVNAGSKAELFKYGTTAGASGLASTLTDFYGDTETSSNVGAYFTLNTATGTLDYVGAPGAVVNPVPEASEWAMMLSGLGMLGLMVRRRRNNI